MEKIEAEINYHLAKVEKLRKKRIEFTKDKEFVQKKLLVQFVEDSATISFSVSPGEFLRLLRNKAKLSSNEVSKKVSISQRGLVSWETCSSRLNHQKFEQVKKVLLEALSD